MKESMKNLLYRIAAEIKNKAQEEAPYRTGNLRNDIQVFDDRIESLEVRIGNTKLASYAPYVHQGTGVHGPKGVRITPKTGKALKFKIGGQVIFRKSVAGQKPNPYMKRAFDKYKSGGLERALHDSGLGEEVLKAFRKALKNTPNIKFA